jgi:hypothetical protein
VYDVAATTCCKTETTGWAPARQTAGGLAGLAMAARCSSAMTNRPGHLDLADLDMDALGW